MQKTKEMFDSWNEKKKDIEFSKSKKDFQIRIWEFYRYLEWINIGNEISKDDLFMRVCIILQNDLWNWLLLMAPITTKYHKRMQKYLIKVNNPEKYGLKECRIITNQVKLIDKKRIVNITGHYKPLNLFSKKILYKYRNLILKKSPQAQG